MSLYHDKDISYLISNKQVLQTTVDKNKSDHIEYRGEYGVNTMTLAWTLKDGLEKFIFENKLANEISKRYHTFIDLRHKKYRRTIK